MTDQSVKLSNKREQIMEAARRLFYEKGFYRTTMDDIARAAGVAKGTVYLYFKSKVELLLSIIESEHIKILDFVQELVRSPLNPKEKISRFIDMIWDILYTARHMITISEFSQKRIIFEEGFKEHYMTRIMPLRKAIMINLKSILDEGVREGIFHLEDTDFAIRWMLFSIPGAFYSSEGKVRYEDRELIKALIFYGLSGERR